MSDDFREVTKKMDVISRQEAIEIVDFECGGELIGTAKIITKRLSDLPSAQPEQLERCPIYDGVCGYPSDQCYGCPRHHGAQPEQRWIPCGKCIHADGKHRWCKILDRSINEDYFCCWAEPYRKEGEA